MLSCEVELIRRRMGALGPVKKFSLCRRTDDTDRVRAKANVLDMW